MVSAWLIFQTQSGCGPDCFDQFELSVSEGIDGGEGKSCEILLSSGDKVVHYSAGPTPASDGGGALPGDLCSAEAPVIVPCVTVSGPTLPGPYGCFRQMCMFSLSASGAAAQSVSDFLGSTSFDITVSCGGTVLRRDHGQISTRGCNG